MSDNEIKKGLNNYSFSLHKANEKHEEILRKITVLHVLEDTFNSRYLEYNYDTETFSEYTEDNLPWLFCSSYEDYVKERKIFADLIEEFTSKIEKELK